MKSKLEDEIDALFTLPLAEFTSVRNTLATRLKKEGRPDEADRVKLLAKPPVSAWAVNQLYWNCRDEFEQLIVTGKRFHSAQASRSAAKAANMRDSLEARRVSLIELSDLATQLLQEAGNNPSQDTLRRITTTLEALSAYALLPDGPTPGRLTQDVDPPSFELLASLISGGTTISHTETPARGKSSSAAPTTRQKSTANAEARQIRQAKIAEAKLLLQEAKKGLSDARATAQSLEAAQKKAHAEAKEAEKQKRAAEERLQRATAVAENATRRAQTAADEAQEAAQMLEDAKRSLEAATKELESLLRGSGT
jgi:hypothetical protein